jgi:hypothetical protein
MTLLWAMFQRPSFPLALLIGVLVSYHFYQYDLSFLLLPVSLTLNQAVVPFVSSSVGSPLSQKFPLRSRRSAVAIFLSVLLLLPPIYMLLMLTGRIYLFVCPLVPLLFYLSASADGDRGFALPKHEHGKRLDEGLAPVYNEL